MKGRRIQGGRGSHARAAGRSEKARATWQARELSIIANRCTAMTG
jgi:hypothetical protein